MGGVIASQMGGTWAVGDMTFTVYNHVGPPGSTSCSGMAGMMMPGETAMVNESFQSPPTSNHSGGVNLLLGDGSVHFIKNSVSLNVWRAPARATAVRSSVPRIIEPDSITVALTAVALARGNRRARLCGHSRDGDRYQVKARAPAGPVGRQSTGPMARPLAPRESATAPWPAWG